MTDEKLLPEWWSISQAELDGWLDGIAAARILIAPTSANGVLLYRQVRGSKDIPGAFIRPMLSIKDVFFPATESLFTIKKKGQDVILEEEFPDWETVIFGVRPCDARGAKLLDALFVDTEPADPFYIRRRQNTTLIGLACEQMGPSCFCTSTGGRLDDPEGMDIMLYRDGQGYLVEALTGKGHFLIPVEGWKKTENRHEHLDLAAQFTIPGKGKWLERFTDSYWEKVSERCLSCRACAYVCPTCRCFAVRDEAIRPGEFERIRCWDSCAGENYRRVAGGHRPRAKRMERLRNRLYCKFVYYPEQVGLETQAACTGCGRCIDACPAGVDITEVLYEMEKIG